MIGTVEPDGSGPTTRQAGAATRAHWLKLAFPFALAVLILAFQSGRASWKVREAVVEDLRLAHYTLVLGTLADAAPGSRPEPSRAQPPGHPMIVAAAARLDSSLAKALACFALEGQACDQGRALRVLLVLQTLATLACLGFIYLIGLELSGSRDIASLTLLLSLLGGHFGEFVRYYGPDSYIFAALFGSLYLLVRANRTGRLATFALAGVALGIGALFRPHYLYLGLLAMPVIFLVRHRYAGASLRAAAGAALAIAVAAWLVAAPWMARNLALFGDPAIADRSQALLLSTRLAYNSMTGAQWWLSWPFWTPVLGYGGFPHSYPPDLVNKLGGAHPGAPVQLAATQLYEATLRGAGPGGQVATLVREHLLANLGKHLLTSLPVLYKGLWGSALLLIAIPMLFVPRLVRTLRATDRLAGFALLAGVSLALLIIQALLTPNAYWMNLQMVPIYAFALAYAAGGL
jgi:hypothetical protein